MANKQINDLQARSDFDETCNLPADDASQTWRVTGAQIKTFIQTAIAPITTLGDIIYGAAAGAPTRLAGNTAAVKKVLKQTGTGSVSAAPAWEVPIMAAMRFASKTANYTIDPTNEDAILADGTSGAFTITLPAAASWTGSRLFFKKTDTSANAVTVDGNSSELVGLELTRKLAFKGDSILIVSDGSNWLIVCAVGRRIATIADSQSSGGTGGTATSGSQLTRPLSVLVDPHGIVTSLGSNQFVLPAGRYFIQGSAPFFQINYCKLILRNITDSSNEILGENGYADASTGASVSTPIRGFINITAAKTFELQYEVLTTKSSVGLGLGHTFGINEIFANLEIEKLD